MMSFILKYVDSAGREATWPPLPDEKAALSTARSLDRQKCTLVSLTRPNGSVVGPTVLAVLLAKLPPET